MVLAHNVPTQAPQATINARWVQVRPAKKDAKKSAKENAARKRQKHAAGMKDLGCFFRPKAAEGMGA